jgi:hypothetical protein
MGIISYINASWFDDIREYHVKWDPRIYQAAQERAEEIMTASDPLELAPEGKMAGGKECEWCAWVSHCANVTVRGVPSGDGELAEDDIEELSELRNAVVTFAAQKAEYEQLHANACENIKKFLRERNLRKFMGSDFSVSYSAISGRVTYDFAAIAAAGIDLSPYTKTGKPSDRITIR